MGAGPMTGRRAGYGAPGFTNTAVSGHDRIFGAWGGGRCWRHMFYATGLPGWMRFGHTSPIPQQGTDALKAQAESLKQELDVINKRIAGLKGKP